MLVDGAILLFIIALLVVEVSSMVDLQSWVAYLVFGGCLYPSSAFDHGVHCYACAQIQQGISLHNKQKALVPIIYQLPQLGWTTFHVALDLMITYDYPSNVQLLYMGYIGATNNHQKS